MFPWVLSNDFLSPRCSFIIAVMTLFVKEFLIRRLGLFHVKRDALQICVAEVRFPPSGGRKGGLLLVFLLHCVICHEVF